MGRALFAKRMPVSLQIMFRSNFFDHLNLKSSNCASLFGKKLLWMLAHGHQPIFFPFNFWLKIQISVFLGPKRKSKRLLGSCPRKQFGTTYLDLMDAKKAEWDAR